MCEHGFHVLRGPMLNTTSGVLHLIKLILIHDIIIVLMVVYNCVENKRLIYLSLLLILGQMHLFEDL